MTRYSLPVRQDIIKIDQKQMTQELERRSTLENKNWSDRSSRSTTTTPLLIVTVHNVALIMRMDVFAINYTIRGGGGALKAPPPPIFCPHAFNFGATLLCVGDFSKKII